MVISVASNKQTSYGKCSEVYLTCWIALLESLGLDSGSIKLGYACEKSDAKRKWIQFMHQQCGSDKDTCVFNDLGTMSSPTAECATHGHKCPTLLEHPAFVSAGFPCKTMSSLHNTTIDKSKCLPECTGVSGEGFQHVLMFIKAHTPRMLQIENVTKLFSEENFAYMTACIPVSVERL